MKRTGRVVLGVIAVLALFPGVASASRRRPGSPTVDTRTGSRSTSRRRLRIRSRVPAPLFVLAALAVAAAVLVGPTVRARRA